MLSYYSRKKITTHLGVIQAFYREAITWKYLDSEYILPFLGVAEVELYGPCLLSPWMEKGDITYYLENNTASDEQLIGFVMIYSHYVLPVLT
ncbi:MAG TPA: hypothetical protein VGO47_05535 [Chlamydiales bacterium]|nr:hypothetical protein [Chlamydiales bacterium]